MTTEHFKPADDWKNIEKWMKKTDAARNQLMRNVIREEFKNGFAPISNRVSLISIVLVLVMAFDVAGFAYLVIKYLSLAS